MDTPKLYIKDNGRFYSLQSTLETAKKMGISVETLRQKRCYGLEMDDTLLIKQGRYKIVRDNKFFTEKGKNE